MTRGMGGNPGTKKATRPALLLSKGVRGWVTQLSRWPPSRKQYIIEGKRLGHNSMQDCNYVKLWSARNLRHKRSRPTPHRSGTH